MTRNDTQVAPTTPPQEDRLLTIPQVADLLQVSTKTVLRAIDRGDLPVINPEAPPTSGHWLYIAYAGDDLLYIGITSSGFDRLRQHASDAPWATVVTRFEIEHHATRAQAVAREDQLIKERAPLWNRRGCAGARRIRESDLNTWIDAMSTPTTEAAA